jgi:MOSC domain-containing protein YiiM
VLLLGGDALVAVTGLRNPCAQIERFQTGLLDQVAFPDDDGVLVRRAGIMGVVVRGGAVTVGDEILVSTPPGPARPLERV